MNDPADLPPDEKFDVWLAPLRAVECPLEVQRTNRQAIDEALMRSPRSPWWRRSVAIPIPVAIAASLALVVAAAVSLRPALAQTAGSSEPRQTAARADYTPENPGWHFTRSYIFSIESFAQDRHSLRPAVTEDRDES
jgi:hypothetical protein